MDDTPISYGIEPAQCFGSSVYDLMHETELLSEAFNKPTLYAGYRFPQEYKHN